MILNTKGTDDVVRICNKPKTSLEKGINEFVKCFNNLDSSLRSDVKQALSVALADQKQKILQDFYKKIEDKRKLIYLDKIDRLIMEIDDWEQLKKEFEELM